MSANNQNSLIIAVAFIIIVFTIIMFGPVVLKYQESFTPNSLTSFVMIFGIGFMFILFLFVLLAIKQRRNFYG